MNKRPLRFVVCTNRRGGTEASCGLRGGDALLAHLKHRGIEASPSVCLGHCPRGPNARVLGGEFVHFATAEKLDDVVSAHEGQDN